MKYLMLIIALPFQAVLATLCWLFYSLEEAMNTTDDVMNKLIK